MCLQKSQWTPWGSPAEYHCIVYVQLYSHSSKPCLTAVKAMLKEDRKIVNLSNLNTCLKNLPGKETEITALFSKLHAEKVLETISLFNNSADLYTRSWVQLLNWFWLFNQQNNLGNSSIWHHDDCKNLSRVWKLVRQQLMPQMPFSIFLQTGMIQISSSLCGMITTHHLHPSTMLLEFPICQQCITWKTSHY